jgi:cytochrome b561
MPARMMQPELGSIFSRSLSRDLESPMQQNVPPIPEYSAPARLFHWATAFLFLLQFPAGYAIALGIPGDLLMNFHMTTGLLIFWLVLLRAAYRLKTFGGRGASRLAPWQRTTSALVHTGIYSLLLCVPLMGWLATYSMNGGAAKSWIPLPPALIPGKQAESLILYWHGIMAFALLGAIFIHIAVAMQGYLEGHDVEGHAEAEQTGAGQKALAS